MMTTVSVEERIRRARVWVDLQVPFQHLGRDTNGADCIGLLVYCVSYPEEKIPAYPRDPYQGKLEAALDTALGPHLLAVGPEGVQAAALLPGDVVAMAYGAPVRHVGIVAQHPAYPEQLSLIHTDSSVGRVTEHILDDKWLRRIRKVWR